MKAYKGFNKNMTCRGFQYKEGETYETKQAKLCEEGFHACEDPIDCLSYYIPASSRYHEVDLEDNGERQSDDSKVVGRKIKIGAELSIAKICELHFEYVKNHTTLEYTDEKAATAGEYGAATAGEYGAATAGYAGAATAGNRGAATAGYAGAATAGNRGAATAGYAGAATAGNRGAATAGYAGAATAGNRGAATAGYAGAATAGNRGAATAGEYGAATAGYAGAATSRGSVSVGKEGIACARGNGCKARGGLGAILLLVEEMKNSYKVKEWKAVEVDGEKIKADTWYTLKDGELVEVTE